MIKVNFKSNPVFPLTLAGFIFVLLDLTGIGVNLPRESYMFLISLIFFLSFIVVLKDGKDINS